MMAHIVSAMTLSQLEYLVALDTYRHFQRAAEACHVSQPSLSAQIQKLEEELGVILFDRGARPIVPTPLAEQIIAHARIVLAEVARLEAIVQEATGEMAGELRLGILSTIAPYLLPIIVQEFTRHFPNVSLKFDELRFDEIIESIRRDTLDAGLVASPYAAPDIIEKPLFEEPLVGYVAVGHRLYDRERIRADDLDLADLWLMSRGHCFREQVLRLFPPTRRQESLSTSFESGNLETLQRLVDRGKGMTLLPLLAVSGEGSHSPQSVRHFEDPPPTRTVRMVYSRISLKKHLIRVLTKTVVTAVEPHLP